MIFVDHVFMHMLYRSVTSQRAGTDALEQKGMYICSAKSYHLNPTHSRSIGMFLISNSFQKFSYDIRRNGMRKELTG